MVKNSEIIQQEKNMAALAQTGVKKTTTLPSWVMDEMQANSSGTGFVKHTANAKEGFREVLKKHSAPTVGQQAGHSMSATTGKVVKAGVQAAIITEGFNQWDRLLTHPEIATDAIQGTKDFYQTIKDLPPDKKAEALATMSVDIVKEVGKNFKNSGQEMVEKGVGIARDLYEMDPETRSQFLKDVCAGTVKNLDIMAKSVREVMDLPMEDKLALAKNLGSGAMQKGKTLFEGARKIYDSITSR